MNLDPLMPMNPIKISSEPDIFIALKDGETYVKSSGGATEEGFDKSWHVYTRDGFIISLEITRQAQDCDGRIEQSKDLEWSVTSGTLNNHGYPNWQEVDSSQRDYAAESMGC